MSEPTPNADSLLRAAIAFAVVEMDMEGELPPSKRAWLNMAMAYAKSKDEPPAAVQAGEREALNQIHGIAKQAFYRQGGESMRLIMQLAENSGAAVQAGDVRECWVAFSDEFQYATLDKRQADEYAVRGWPTFRMREISAGQPPTLTALVEAAREALESLDGLANVTTGIFLNADYQAKHRLRAALTPFLDPAQPKQEAPNGR